MRTFGEKTHHTRATEMLLGMIEGLASNCEITEGDVIGLNQWLEMHQSLLHEWPFNELYDLIKDILEDGIVSEQEKEDLLAWCEELIDPTALDVGFYTEACQQLHGVLNGIILDGVVEESEVYGLYDWIQKYDIFRHAFPFNLVFDLVEDVLADGIVTEEEKQRVKELCEHFSETQIEDTVIYDIPENVHATNSAPILKPNPAICESVQCFSFEDSTFCFTGHAQYGSRKELEEIVRQAGGTPIKNITLKLDYLVLGLNGQPCWIYSTYGRKIEKVMDYRGRGAKTRIISEHDFISAVKDNGIQLP